MGTDGTFPDFLSCGSRKSRQGGDCGIPPLRKGPRKDGAPGTRHRRIMADVGAESMVGGTTFRRKMIQREISRALVLNLSGKASGARALPRISLPLTAPSLLSRRTRQP